MFYSVGAFVFMRHIFDFTGNRGPTNEMCFILTRYSYDDSFDHLEQQRKKSMANKSVTVSKLNMNKTPVILLLRLISCALEQIF